MAYLSIDDTGTATTGDFRRRRDIMSQKSRNRSFYTSPQCHLDPSSLVRQPPPDGLRPDPASTRPRSALDSTTCEPAFETAIVCRKGKRIRSIETKPTHLRHLRCLQRKAGKADPSEHVPIPRDAHTHHDSLHGSRFST
jgi:hypothetical protein